MQTEQQNQIMQSEFPLVSRWADEVMPVLDFSNTALPLICNGDVGKLASLGFPVDLLEIMQMLCAAPQVLLSTAHATEVDLYKNSSFVNMHILMKMLRSQGYDIARILVQYYDTVSAHGSTRSPLRVGGKDQLGSDTDLFGFAGKTHETVVVDNDTIQRALDTFSERIPQFGEMLMRQLNAELSAMIKQDEFLSWYKVQARETITNLLIDRLTKVVSIGNEALTLVGREVSIAEYMMKFEQLLAGHIFTTSSTPRGYEQRFGFDAQLFSQNNEFLSLVKSAIRLLVEKRGIGIIKSIVDPGEGLAIVCAGRRGNVTQISINSEEKFSIKTGNSVDILTDEEFLALLDEPTTLPLGKLEQLIICLAPQMLHMGSEYGIRERLLQALGFSGQAYEMQLHARIGDDKEAGNDGILIGNGYLNMIFGYILFGVENMRRLLGKKIGKTSQPDKYDMRSYTTLASSGNLMQIEGLRSIVAKSLVRQITPIITEQMKPHET